MNKVSSMHVQAILYIIIYIYIYIYPGSLSEPSWNQYLHDSYIVDMHMAGESGQLPIQDLFYIACHNYSGKQWVSPAVGAQVQAYYYNIGYARKYSYSYRYTRPRIHADREQAL